LNFTAESDDAIGYENAELFDFLKDHPNQIKERTAARPGRSDCSQTDEDWSPQDYTRLLAEQD
jgi:hypothetical protein